MSDLTVNVVIDAEVPANTVSATVAAGKVTVTVSLQVEDAALAVLDEPIAKAVREDIRRRGNPNGLLMVGIV